MNPARTCASPACSNDVVRRPGARGRPRIYCSPACRPSRTASGRQLSVEMDQLDHDEDGAGRCWLVRLRRGNQAVIVGQDLGRFSATALYDDLIALLRPAPDRKETRSSRHTFTPGEGIP